MIVPQPPTLQVFIPTQIVPCANVPAERFPPVATIQANHIILVYGTSHRHKGRTKLLWLIWLSKLTECSVYCRDEI